VGGADLDLLERGACLVDDRLEAWASPAEGLEEPEPQAPNSNGTDRSKRRAFMAPTFPANGRRTQYLYSWIISFRALNDVCGVGLFEAWCGGSHRRAD
jgi:hypothetical protein